jgi:hypothetical protein
MLSTCKDAKAAGFKAGKECYEAGFTYDEGKAAGFPSRVMIYSTFSPSFWWQNCKSPSTRIRTQVDPCHRAPLRLASIAVAATPCRRACGHTVPPRVRPAHSKVVPFNYSSLSRVRR